MLIISKDIVYMLQGLENWKILRSKWGFGVAVDRWTGTQSIPQAQCKFLPQLQRTKDSYGPSSHRHVFLGHSEYDCGYKRLKKSVAWSSLFGAIATMDPNYYSTVEYSKSRLAKQILHPWTR